MNGGMQAGTKDSIARVGLLLFCGLVGFFAGDFWAHQRMPGGIAGMWGSKGVPVIAFYPNHTFSYVNDHGDPKGLSGQWYELKEAGDILLVYGFPEGFTVTAKLQSKPLRLDYTESDMVCRFEKIGYFASAQ